MFSLFQPLNVGLSFVLELIAIAAYGYWGFQLPIDGWGKWAIGIGLPLVLAILWGLFLAPKAGLRPNIPWVIVAKFLILSGASVALYNSGLPELGVVVAGLVVVNLFLAWLWGQEQL